MKILVIDRTQEKEFRWIVDRIYYNQYVIKDDDQLSAVSLRKPTSEEQAESAMIFQSECDMVLVIDRIRNRKLEDGNLNTLLGGG